MAHSRSRQPERHICGHSCFLTACAGLSRPRSGRWQRTRPHAIRRRMLDLEERGDVAIMRLQHGKVNALDLELLLAITEAMRAADQARAVVITGSGSVFSAGVDLQRIVAGGRSYVQEFLPALSESFMAIFDHPGPVVAAVNGHAIAGG